MRAKDKGDERETREEREGKQNEEDRRGSEGIRAREGGRKGENERLIVAVPRFLLKYLARSVTVDKSYD